jgi:teichuronic acid biosynthesis glycosyltransferase TuaC
MRIVTLTRLWPNCLQPHHGVFVEERMRRVADRPGSSLSVVAPVPWFPRLPWPPRYALLGAVPKAERLHGIDVAHPRYTVIPKVGLALQGAALRHAALPALRALLPFDVLDSHFLYPDGWAAVEAARQLGVPCVVSARGSDANTLPDEPGMRARVQATIEGATMLIAVSRPIADRLVDLGADPRKIAVIPNGIDAVAFDYLPLSRPAIRAHVGCGPSETMILSVGRLERVKGHDLLIEALARYAQQPYATPFRLAIVGEGSQREALGQRARAAGIEDRVLFAGAVAHDALAGWYSAADLFCLPSRGEGHPNALVEALACGTPAVAAAVGAVPAVVDPTAGLVVPPGDVEALEAALSDAIGRSWAGEWRRAAIRATVAGRSWEAVAEQVEDVFREALARAGRGVRRGATSPRVEAAR